MNGLSKAEEQMLRKRLTQLDAVLTRRHLLGGGEASKMMDLADSIRLRLDPPTAEDLDAKADKMLDSRTGLGGLTWASAILAGLQ